jgi:hypothetical protein
VNENWVVLKNITTNQSDLTTGIGKSYVYEFISYQVVVDVADIFYQIKFG